PQSAAAHACRVHHADALSPQTRIALAASDRSPWRRDSRCPAGSGWLACKLRTAARNLWLAHPDSAPLRAAADIRGVPRAVPLVPPRAAAQIPAGAISG